MGFSLQCGSWIGRIRRSSIEDMEDLKAIEVPGTVQNFDEIPYSTYTFDTKYSYIKHSREHGHCKDTLYERF